LNTITGCRNIDILEGIQNLSRHSCGQPALVDPALHFLLHFLSSLSSAYFIACSKEIWALEDVKKKIGREFLA